MANSENTQSYDFKNMTDEELSKEITFKIKASEIFGSVIIIVVIFAIVTFFSGFIITCSSKTTLTLYNSGVSMQLPEGWHVATNEKKYEFLSGIEYTETVTDENVLFSNDAGHNFFLSINRDLSKEEIKSWRTAFRDKRDSVFRHKGTRWLLDESSLEGYWLYTARHGKKLYAVSSNTGDDAILAIINIKPFGFFRGLLDGLLLPSQALGRVFIDTLHPVKTVNNGFSYILGFVIGCIFLLGIIVVIYFGFFTFSDQIEEAEKKEEARKVEVSRRKAEAARLEWERKWAAMSIDEKVGHVTQIFTKKQANNLNQLEKLNAEYTKITAKFQSKSPGKVLAQFDKQVNTESDTISKIGGFLKNAISAGEAGLEDAKAQYNQLASIYKYYHAEYMVSLQNLEILNAEYNFICEKAILYMQKIKEIITALPLKDRTAFDKLEKVQFSKGLLGDKSIREVFKSIQKLNANYSIQAKQSWDKSLNTAGNIFKSTDKYLTKQMKKKKGNLSDDDLFVAGIGAAAGLVTVAAEGVNQYFGNIDKTNEAKTRLAKAELKLRKGIEDIVKTNMPKVKGLIEREEELIHSLNESMERYILTFNNVNSYIFPASDNVLLTLNLPFYGQAYKVCQESALSACQYSCLLINAACNFSLRSASRFAVLL